MSTEPQSNREPKEYSRWFLMVTAIFVTCLITANITAVKLVNIFGLVLPAAVIIFPISYIIGDVLTEVYGYQHARRVIWLGFLCNLITVVAIWLGQMMPSAGFWDGQAAYARILGYTPRLLVASFLAYLAGEFANSFVLARMKIATKGRWLWSLIFITIAFAGTIPASGLLNAIITQWLVKTAYEALATPLTYLVVNTMKRLEGIDTYDYDTKFNPLQVS